MFVEVFLGSECMKKWRMAKAEADYIIDSYKEAEVVK